jgi:hypothetical protein
MTRARQRISRLASVGLLGIAILLQGCATSIEVKNASRAQMELIDTLDRAVANLQTALDQFHRDKEARILEEGRMLVARQAIDVAVSNSNSMVTADQLFDTYKKKVEPWVDNAFSVLSIDQQIVALEKRVKGATDPVLKVAMQNDLDDLKTLKANLHNKPKRVKEIESIIMDDLNKERKTAKQNHEMLEILRDQVALMSAMHEKVDAWLAIDITVTQEQVDALKEAFTSARQAIEGGGQ